MSLKVIDDELDDHILKQFAEYILTVTGISISMNKKVMLERRLKPRLLALNLNTYAKYLDLLKKNDNELQEFINLVTTNETYFFRTDGVWEFFQKDFLPVWFEENPKQQLKIWSGASSTGEEIYSLAMSCDQFLTKNPGFSYSILGTDIDTNVLDTAINAVYQGRSISKLEASHPAFLVKYFEKNDSNFKIVPKLLDHVEFKRHSLFDPLKSIVKFDIIFLRNVLIYFKKEEQEKVLAHIANALKPNGTLVIGESESLKNIETRFEFSKPLVYQLKAS